MASLTLVEAAKIQQNPLISGIIESIVTVNPVYQIMPFDQIVGNALLYTRENAIGGVAPIGIGGGSNTIPAAAKTPATFTPVTTPLKAMIGDAMVDHFIEVTSSNNNSQSGTQLASKAKGLGREYQRQFILGDSSVNPLEFDGIAKLMPAAQKVAGGSVALTLEMIDETIDKVKAKDGAVDFGMANDLFLRKMMSVLRTAGGASIAEWVNMPGGQQALRYRGIFFYRNDWIPFTGAAPDRITDLYMGCFDDGSRKVGLAGLTSVVQSGIFVSHVGESETTNDIIDRLRFYASLAVFSELGMAKLESVKVG
jgi:hypothetical protein